MLRGAPFVAVMQPADFRNCHDDPGVERGIAIADEIAWRVVPRERLAELLFRLDSSQPTATAFDARGAHGRVSQERRTDDEERSTQRNRPLNRIKAGGDRLSHTRRSREINRRARGRCDDRKGGPRQRLGLNYIVTFPAISRRKTPRLRRSL